MPVDSLVFRCPECQQPFRVLAEQAGQVVRCPGCEEPVQIPSAQPPQPSVAPSNQSPTQSNAAEVQQSSGAQAKEEVLPYGCPECEKPFGIYASMYGSEMACPHCRQTILVQPKTKPSVEKKAKSSTSAVASSGAKQKPPPKKNPPVSKPPVSAQPESKTPKANSPSVAPVEPQHGDSPPPTPPPPPKPEVAGSSGESVSAQTKPANQPVQRDELPQTDEVADAPVVVFTPQPVDHLLPPKFSAVDPEFFYRRHQDGSQVLLPSADGSMKVVDNRIVRIEHNGQTYELISSPRYERIQRMVVTNVLAVIICGLLIAIVMTLLNG